MVSDIEQFKDASLPDMWKFVEYVVSQNKDYGIRYRKKFMEQYNQKLKALETRVAGLEKENEFLKDYAKIRSRIDPQVYL